MPATFTIVARQLAYGTTRMIRPTTVSDGYAAQPFAIGYPPARH
jgi:hypothetical protein